jgi:L-fuculose-phosphate aldolase
MSVSVEDVISQLIEFGKTASEKGLIWANSGNISFRLNENSFIITGSGAHLGDLKGEDFVLLEISGKVLEGEKKPSLESKMHSAIYKSRPEVAAVFHSQAFFTTLLSCTKIEVNPNLFPESMAYLNCVMRVSYNHPGSHDLADEVSKKIAQCPNLILNNHGAICAGSKLFNVLLRTETLEMLSRMMVMARVSEIDLNFLPEDLKDDFLKHLKQIKGSM